MKVFIKAIISCALIGALIVVLAGCAAQSEAEKNWQHGDIMTYEQYVRLNNLSVELTPQIVDILDTARDNAGGIETDAYEEMINAAQAVYSLNDSLKDINTFKNADIDSIIKTFEGMEKSLPELKKMVSE